MTAMQDLLAKVEAGEASTMGFEDAGFDGWAELAYFGSLDAAKALHDAVLPGFEWIARSDAENGGFANVMSPDWDAYCDILDQDGNTLQKGETVAGAAFHAYSPDPARAWLIAILRALIAQEEGA